MCGISAIVHLTGGRVDANLVARMNTRVSHRGPNDAGVYEGPSLALGHRRLSILDLSEAGHQPMAHRDRSVVTYNGEIYNYVELRAELVRAGYEFATSTDTEVLLAAYDHWGEACVRRFNGMWAFVLWDRQRRVLFCSRDRFGVKPLHYVRVGDMLAIGSEVKQFLELPGFNPAPDPVSLYRFLVDASVNTDERDFVSGVRSLRGGHNLRVELDSGSYTIERYYDLASAAPPRKISFSDACREFSDLFSDAVRIRLRSDVNVGVCLSGGIDSSSIASVAKRVSSAPDSLRTVSCVWNEASCDESLYIDEVVRAHRYQAVYSRPDMDDLLQRGRLDRLVYHQDQPVISASQFAEFEVFSAARENGLVVMLDGQGADEYLAGYSWLYPPFFRTLLTSGRFASAAREIYARSQTRRVPMRAVVRSLWNALVLAPLRDRARAAARSGDLAGWAGPLLNELHHDPHAAVIRYHSATGLRELSLRELLETSMPHQLHSEDRNSMLHSVESRLPFMDYRLVELGLSLPDDCKLRNGATKVVLRDGLRGVLPELIRNRHDKLGFPAPEETWIRSNGASVRGQLAAAVERFDTFLTPDLLKQFDQMLERRAPYDGLYFRVVSLQRWAEVFCDGGSSALVSRADDVSSRELLS